MPGEKPTMMDIESANQVHIPPPVKVRAIFPLTHHTLMPKGLQHRQGQFIHKFL